MVKECTRCRRKEGDQDPEGNEVTMASNSRCNRCRKYDSVRNPNLKNEMRNKYPVAHDKIVYGFKEDGIFVYIGETTEGAWRIYEHLNKKKHKSFCCDINPLERQKRFKWSVLWYGDNDAHRKHQEKELIKLHQPKYNKTHNNG